jgi:hypothetical protein
MIYYYFNNKNCDLFVFNAEANDLTILERLEGISVITTSEIKYPEHEDERGRSRSSPICKKCGIRGHRSNSPKFHKE